LQPAKEQHNIDKIENLFFYWVNLVCLDRQGCFLFLCLYWRCLTTRWWYMKLNLHTRVNDSDHQHIMLSIRMDFYKFADTNFVQQTITMI